MKRILFAIAALAIGLAIPAPTWSKGRTVKIEVRGDDLASPIQITDPGVVKSFNIWNGPGVRVNNEPVHLDPDKQAGAFIGWPNAVVTERPSGLRRYEILFHIEGRQHGSYVVFYEFSPSVEGDYIYLPGEGDDNVRTNTFLTLTA